MSLNETSSGERLHIAFFGMRNAGKSSLVNAVTSQSLSIVSDVKGTTTDPVKKAMELLPLGPVVIIDTPGLDDEGELGELRVEKTRQILAKTDIAVLVVDATVGMSAEDEKLKAELQERKIPHILVYNKCELLQNRADDGVLYVSAEMGIGIDELKNKLGEFAKAKKSDRTIISDKLKKGDIVVLVTPIDESAPKGRLIMPQQMTIRDILDVGAIAVVCQVPELASTLNALKDKPKMVITDSQVFGKVAQIVGDDIPLTSFSILMARYKGDLPSLIKGAMALSELKDGDRVLISEGCTHHRQCNDIGTVKMPEWIRQHCGAEPSFEFTSGGEFPTDLSKYKVIVHCGGCMLNETEMKNRISTAKKADTPMVNYGVAIAHMNGILKRSINMFDI